MEENKEVESTNEEVEETKEEETKEEETTNNEVEPQQETEGSYSKSDIDSKFILFEDRIRAYINEVLNSKNENTNEEVEQQKERNWD